MFWFFFIKKKEQVIRELSENSSEKPHKILEAWAKKKKRNFKEPGCRVAFVLKIFC